MTNQENASKICDTRLRQSSSRDITGNRGKRPHNPEARDPHAPLLKRLTRETFGIRSANILEQ